MIVKWTPFGEIRGKLSLTPEEAEEMFGYRMKPGAIGVYFQKRHGKLIIGSLMPQRNIEKSESHIYSIYRLKIISKVYKELKKVISPLWDAKAKAGGYRYISGFNLFVHINGKRVGLPPDWRKLILTEGELESPQIKAVRYAGPWLMVRLSKVTPFELHLAVFEPKQDLLKYLGCVEQSPNIYLNLVHRLTNPTMVYAFMKKGSDYSDSVCIEGIPGRLKWQNT